MLSIRTQDRMSLVPYDNQIMVRDDGAIFIEVTNGNRRKLAQYSSKARAIEVLDEIQVHLNGNLFVSDTTSGSETLVPGTVPIVAASWIMPIQPQVYEMPKE